ncbi:MAG TPA: VOC family protein [Gammaproteobacteria bacterium]|nr:VOC family protein [Gammaproteobacteria bacterium]
MKRVGQIGLMVKDVESATAFYRDKLGIRHMFSAAGMAFFDLGEVRLMLGQVGKPEDRHPASLIYYRVDDIDAAAKTLQQRGVHMVEAPELAYSAGGVELWLAFFHDMDQNVFALMCEKKVAA